MSLAGLYTFHYAKESTPEGEVVYVRFPQEENRRYWVSQSPYRATVRTDNPALKALLSRGVTWNHQDGVSYMNPGELQ